MVAMTTITPIPPNADTLANLPSGNIFANRVDHAGDFMSWNARVRETGKVSFDGKRIGVTNATCIDSNSDQSGLGRREFTLDEFQ